MGLSWREYVDQWVRDSGGWVPLADALIHRAGGAVEIPADPQTVERGLRRLAARGHKPGGQYGRWMLRFFGFTTAVKDWVKWMGQYHTRFADLPCSLRLQQLSLWDRPPVAESRLAAWVAVGRASVHHRLTDLKSCAQWLSRAEAGARAAGPSAEIEVHLFHARVDTDGGRRDEARRRFEAVDRLLGESELSRTDLLCYRARLNGQRGYHHTKPVAGEPADLTAARHLFLAIEEDAAIPFVSFRKAAGLAYCTWKQGDAVAGATLAQRAADYAGDGGLVRFRVMALNMLSRMLPEEQAAPVRVRAERMARRLEDEDLLRRVARGRRSPR